MQGRSERGAAVSTLLIVGAIGLAGLTLGTGLVLTGVIDPLEDDDPNPSVTSSSVDLLDCRDGVYVDSLYDGDSVFIVGIDPTSSWVAVRRPSDLTAVGWVSTSALDPDGDLRGLPVRPCDTSEGVIGMPIEEAPASTTTTTVAPTTTTTTPPDTTTSSTSSTTSSTSTSTSTSTTSTTEPGDTQPPILLDPLVIPDPIFPNTQTCVDAGEPVKAKAYLTVEGETGPVTATLAWRYLPTDVYDYSGTLDVLVLPDPVNTLLIGDVRNLPDPYPPPISGPPPTPAVVEFEWVVRDAAGNVSTAVVTADLGRCV